MTKFIFLLLFPLFGCISGLSIWDSDSPPQLYSANDTGVVTTNITDLEQKLYNQPKVTVFQFYNSWCGHCQRYAPHFKEFGKLVANWNPVVQVLALNCVDEQNEEVCRNYAVVSYPTVRLFWTNVTSQADTGEHVTDLQHSAEFLRDRTIEFILRNLKNATKSAPSSWPKLDKNKVTGRADLQQLLAKTKLTAGPDSVPVVAIAETNNSLVGQQIILELSNYQDKIEILSLDIPSTNELNFTVDTTAKTALLQFDQNGNSTYRTLASLPLSEKNQTAYYVNYINQNLFDNKLLQPKNLPTSPLPDQPQLLATSPRTNVQPEDVPLDIGDLYGAISYTIHHQIPLKKTLDGRQLNILKRFFDVVERYFPSDDPKFTEFIHGLNQFLKSKEQSLDIQQEYLDYLKKNDYDFKSKFNGWNTCKGSQPKYRGYTCSLWSLFHTMTLSEYIKEKDTQKWVNLHEVLYTMRDYIGTFFSCTDCAQHFTGMATDLENELKYPNSSVLWLWSRHNRVNQRLKGDLTEDPEHPKGVYPYQKDCPQCYAPNGEFIETEVMRYLVSRYGQVKKAEPKQNEPKHVDEQPQSDKLTFQSDPDTFKNNRVFSYADYSLIVMLYALIATIVISVFFYLPIKIKRKAKARQAKYLDA